MQPNPTLPHARFFPILQRWSLTRLSDDSHISSFPPLPNKKNKNPNKILSKRKKIKEKEISSFSLVFTQFSCQFSKPKTTRTAFKKPDTYQKFKLQMNTINTKATKKNDLLGVRIRVKSCTKHLQEERKQASKQTKQNY